MIRPFVENPTELKTLEGSKIMTAYKNAEKGDLKDLKAMYHNGYVFGHEYLLHGGYKLMGWYFDLSRFCKKYLVKVKHYGWQEYQTPNKTCLYNMIGRHNVLEIIER